MPEKAEEMNNRLSEILDEMKASYPYFNPHTKGELIHKEKVCSISDHKKNQDTAEFSYVENGAKVTEAILSYTLNGGHKYEEWWITPAEIVSGNKVRARIPEGATHYFIHLVDENNFLVTYPSALDQKTISATKWKYSKTALSVN